MNPLIKEKITIRNIRYNPLNILKIQLNQIGKGTASMSFGMFLRALCQVIIFISIARLLNASNYGAFTATAALSGALSCYAGLGTEVILLKKTVIDPDKFNLNYGTALLSVLSTFPLFFSIYLCIALFLLNGKVNFIVIAAIGISDILFNQLLAVSVFAYQSFERVGRSAKVMIMPILFRTLFLLPLYIIAPILTKQELLITWVFFYLLASIIAWIYHSYSVNRDLGPPDFKDYKKIYSFIKEGVFFSLGSSAIRINSDIDKTMLAKFSTLDITGIYSAGYRFIDVVNIPLSALLKASLPNFFRTGTTGLHAVIKDAKAMLPIPLIYAVVVGVGLYFATDYIPIIIGRNYELTTEVIKWLIGLPIISVFRLLSQTILGSCGHQKLNVAILFGGVSVNIILNLLLIPTLNWKGTVISTYSSEIFVTVGMLIFLKIKLMVS